MSSICRVQRSALFKELGSDVGNSAFYQVPWQFNESMSSQTPSLSVIACRVATPSSLRLVMRPQTEGAHSSHESSEPSYCLSTKTSRLHSFVLLLLGRSCNPKASSRLRRISSGGEIKHPRAEQPTDAWELCWYCGMIYRQLRHPAYAWCRSHWFLP